MNIKEELRNLAKEARERRLECDEKKDDTEFPIHSYCFDNAFVTYHVMKENNLDPTFVEGTTEWYADTLIQEGVNIEELESTEELAGNVHYWVEVNGHIIDISSHDSDQFGKILVSDGLPESYYRYPDSYERGEEIFENAKDHACSYCGGRKNYCPCED